MSIHDKVFVDTVGAAIVVMDHDLPLRRGRIYNNTVYAATTGVQFGNSASEGDLVMRNLFFAPAGVGGPAGRDAALAFGRRRRVRSRDFKQQ